MQNWVDACCFKLDLILSHPQMKKQRYFYPPLGGPGGRSVSSCIIRRDGPRLAEESGRDRICTGWTKIYLLLASHDALRRVG